MKSIVLSLALVTISSRALADDPLRYGYRAAVQTTFYPFGFEPTRIISPDGLVSSPDGATTANKYHALDDPGLAFEVRGKFSFFFPVLHLEVEPYTSVPRISGLRVSLAGVEARALIPLFSWLRAGYYHHSAHNFNTGDYGHGLQMDAIMIDSQPWQTQFALLGDEVLLSMQASGYWFANHVAYANVPTAQTSTITIRALEPLWRGELHLRLEGPGEAAECGVRVDGHDRPAAFVSWCAAQVSLNPILGAFGQLFLIGPYVEYRRNLVLIDQFGTDALVFGIRTTLRALGKPAPSAPFD